MAKLRRLTGGEVVALLEQLGFSVVRIKGSHYRMKLISDDHTCYTTVPVHGKANIPVGTLKAIYRQVATCIPEDELTPLFYTD